MDIHSSIIHSPNVERLQCLPIHAHELPTPTTIQMNRRNMLNKESRWKILHIVWSHLYEISSKGKVIEPENRPWFAHGLGGSSDYR